MIILQLILAMLIVKTSYSDFIPAFHPFNPVSAPLLPTCPFIQQQSIPLAFQPDLSENTTVLEEPQDNLKFILPFLDMEIQCDRNLLVMQEVKQQQIYILHGHELFQMFINRHQEKRLSLVAVLEGSVGHVETLGAKEYLEVYQLAEDILRHRAEAVKDPTRANEPAPVFEAVQQLTLTGRFQKLFLLSPNEERIMIVAAVNFTKLYGKLRIFEWFSTYFNPIEEITVPSMNVVNVIGSQTKYLVTGRTIKHQERTILTVYEISPISSNLLLKQTLTVESRIVHIFTYRSRNMIVACSINQKKCNSFHQLPDGHFTIYRRRTSKEFAFDLMTSSSKFICAVKQNQVIIFTNHRLDCYGSFISDQRDITDLIGYQNINQENYVLLVYKRPFKALIRIVELEINVRNLSSGKQTEPEENEASKRHQHLFESTIGELRSALLQRKMDMEEFRKASRVLRPKIKQFEVQERITLHAGKVDIIKVVGEHLKTPKQILQRIENLRQIFLHKRLKRADNRNSSNERLEITKRVKVQRMKVENLIYHGDVIEGFSLNQTNSKEKILTIEPKVSTEALNPAELILPLSMRTTRQQTIPDLFFDLIPTVRVSHLKVESINGVPWDVFYNSLFLKNRDKTIEGRLVLQSEVKVKHLMTTILNGLVVSKLFNLKHPQVIHSDLVISRFFANDLKAKTVNGLIFENDIVFSGSDNFVETPVKMHYLRISGDIFLANNSKVEDINFNPDGIELKQFYTNKIIVNGSLIVNNLKRLNNETKIFLGDQKFDENEIKEKYLLKGQAQNFSFPVIFDEAKVTVPFLQTNYLNDHATEQHMLVHEVNTKNPLLLVFMNAHVQGDVKCRDHTSKIAEIKDNIIRPGDKVVLTGSKLFEAPLEIIHAETLTLNQLPVKNLVFKAILRDNKTIELKDSKSFTAIKVKNPCFIEQELQASYLNNLPLESLLNNDYYMDRLSVPHLVETSNIVFHKINGIPFDDFFTKLDVKGDRLVLHRDLIVEGSVQFAENLQLNYINGLLWNDYVENLVRINESANVKGDVCFEKGLSVTKNLETADINGHDLEIILQNILMKSKPQLISGLYYFDNISVSNVDVLIINGLNVSNFVDLSKNVTVIEGDIIVETLNIGRNFQSNLNEFESLFNFEEKIRQLPLKPWKSLYVLNNASWPASVKDSSQHQLLKYLYKSAVKANRDQIITGNVKLSKPLIENMRTRMQFPPNLNLDFIQQDGLLKNSTIKQIIKGEKVFLKSLKMETLKVKRNLYTTFLNGIDVLRFNKSLYRLTSKEPLRGSLKFIKPLTVDHLQVDGLINGLNTALIYQLESNSSLPNVIMLQELYAEKDLFIKNINGMSLKYFLDNRFTLKGPALEHFGVLKFEHLVIEKKALIQSINGIAIESLVFKHSPYLQTITGHKTLAHTLELTGPAHVMYINDKDVMTLYRNTLRRDLNYEFDNLLLEQATFERGLQVSRDSNYNMQQRSFEEIEEDVVNNKEKFLKFLAEFKDNLTTSNTDIIYLDYDLNTHIKWLSLGNLTANQTIFHELSRISCCEKQYIQISFQHPNNIYLKNITSDRLTKISNKIAVKAENYCRFRKHKVKSKITISGQKLLKVFAMKRYIENIYTFDFDNSTEHFVILHALDLPALRRNEVRIFKISTRNNTIEEWQGLTKNIGEKFKFYQLLNLNVLLTNGFIDHHPALTIYHFNNNSQLFKIQQIIDGDYDIMEMIDVPNNENTKHLILSCFKCQRIIIYELSNSKASGKYEILQIITLRSPIDKLVIFWLSNDYYMLVISQPDSNSYHIYKYAYIQGWLHLTFGYFPNLQMSIPVTKLWSTDISSISDGLPLILLCNQDDCYLVKAIV